MAKTSPKSRSASKAVKKTSAARKPRTRPRSELPLITVITPSYNQGKFIQRTIESVLSQNYPRLEYIVVDGGSTDGTLDILREYGDRIRWISERDAGQSSAINKGFRKAKGDIVAWLNSDDVYMPGSLMEAAKHFAAHPDVMMVYGEGNIIDENDRIKRRFPFTEPRFDLWKLIYYGDYILQQTTFYRRKVFDSVDLLDESLCYGMDWDLFIRIGRRFRVDYLPQYLGSIREHGEAKTSTGGVRRFREIVQIIRRHGIRRYPQAYFNYAWDVVSPYVHDPASGSSMMFSRKIVGTSAWVGQRLLRLFWHRLGQGKFDDGWLGRRAMIVLPNKEPEANEKHLVIKGELPAQNAPMNVRLRVNKRLVTEQQLTEPGEFTIAAELSNGVGKAESFHITVDNGRTFVPKSHGISDDCRELGFLLKSIDVVPGPKPESAPGRATEGETASATDVRGKWMSTVLKFGLLALLVALAAMRLDLSSTFRYLSGRTVLYILALQPLVLLCALAMTKRFEVLLQSPGVPYRTIFKAIILANGINVILPARLSEVLKATYINEKTGHSVSRSVSAVVLERIGDIMVFLSLAFASLGSVLFRVNAVYLSAIALAIILGLATLAGSQRLIVGFAERLRSPLLSRFLKQFVTHAAGSLRSRSFYVGQMYGVLAWSCSYLLMTIFIEFNGSISLGFSQTMVLFTATTVGLLIPLLPGGMGTYEAAAVYVLKGFGYSFEEALALALALHLSQLLLFFVLSLVIVAREHLGISRLIKRLRSLSAAGEGSGTSERV